MKKKIITSIIASISLGLSNVALPSNNNLDDIVITAKSNSTGKDIAASVTIITAEEISQTGASSLQDVLKHVPGFSFTTNSSSVYGRQNIGLRGMDSERILILIDGERINSSDGFIGHSNFQSSWLNVNSIEKVEVIKGAGAVLYGSEAMGGVVNIITKGTKKENYGRYSISTSTLPNRTGGNQKSYSLNSGIKVGENLFINTNIATSEKGVVTDNNTLKFESQDQQSIDFKATYNFTPSTELSINLADSHEDRDKENSPYYDLDRKRKGLSFKTELNDWETILKMYEVKSDNAFHGFGESPYYTHEIENTVISAEMSGLLMNSHFLTWGVERHTSDYTQNYSSPARDDYKAQGTIQTSAYIQDKFKLGKGTLTAGFRFDNNDQFGSETSPELGYVLPVSEKIDLKFQYSEAFKAPNIKEADDNYTFSHGYPGASVFQGNSDLKAETSKSFQIGVSGVLGLTSWSAAAYQIEANDLIQSENTGTTSPITFGPLYKYENVDKAKINGAEFTISTDLTDSIFVDASYTALKTDDGDGGKLAFRPDQTLKARLTYEMPKNFSANWSVTHTGEAQDGINKVSAYTVHDFAINKKINPALNLQFAVNNVLDVLNDDSDDNHIAELPGRELKLTLSGAF